MIIKLELTGIVQGVGFRPFAKKQAKALGVRGYVLNKGSAVEILAESDKKALDEYIDRLVNHPPEGSFVLDVKKEILTHSDNSLNEFEILESKKEFGSPLFISPDIATCEKCERELFDKSNRRYRHPFISCAVCGPRYSITERTPYDRENTVMKEFALCKKCEEEYFTTSDRRCFAQTVACRDCGPELFFTEPGNPMEQAVNAIKNERVIAVKDIGGFHFACSAFSEKAVRNLRIIKNRAEKPFAVMFPNTEEIERFCHMSSSEKELLKSSARPIVLLNKKRDLPKPVCGNSPYIGAFLPCNPVQIMLARECGALIMTSGNITDEPIITQNEKMLGIMREKKELFGVLYHNRDILTPLDDSILKVLPDGRVQTVRRARGYVPLPIKTGLPESASIFAAGGDLKSSFCFLKDSYAYMSQHLGDLQDNEAFSVYTETADKIAHLLNATPDYCASDMHPAYMSANYKKAHIKVQHHHAHIASVMAEHGLQGPVLGFAFDGTGYGTDGKVWGCEVLLCENGDFRRLRHLKYTTMCGADLVSKDARRVLECYRADIGECEDKMLVNAIKNSINTAEYSSMGRLFDAVSALLDIKYFNSYEGECATALEAAAQKGKKILPLTFDFDGAKIIKDIELLKENGENINDIALSFHIAIANATVKTAIEFSVPQIALSGGVFNNKILTEECISRLEKEGFKVYINEKVPAGDGGIALGQAYIAAKKLYEKR